MTAVKLNDGWWWFYYGLDICKAIPSRTITNWHFKVDVHSNKIHWQWKKLLLTYWSFCFWHSIPRHLLLLFTFNHFLITFFISTDFSSSSTAMESCLFCTTELTNHRPINVLPVDKINLFSSHVIFSTKISPKKYLKVSHCHQCNGHTQWEKSSDGQLISKHSIESQVNR